MLLPPVKWLWQRSKVDKFYLDWQKRNGKVNTGRIVVRTVTDRTGEAAKVSIGAEYIGPEDSGEKGSVSERQKRSVQEKLGRYW